MKMSKKALIIGIAVTFLAQSSTYAMKDCWGKTRSCFKCCMKEVVDHSDEILAIAEIVLPFPEAQAILSSIKLIKNGSLMKALVTACETESTQPLTAELLDQLRALNFPVNPDGTLSDKVKAVVKAAVVRPAATANASDDTRANIPFAYTILNEEQLSEMYKTN
jgi:hypothetical protein